MATAVAKPKVAKAGVNSAGENWIMITTEKDGFLMRAFITTTKAMKEGDEVNLPSGAKIPWSF